jgi:hypothetical protein
MKVRLSPVLRAVLLLVPLGCASASDAAKGWAESRTRHVTVYTEAKLEHEYIQEWLERSYSAYHALFPDLQPGNINVVWLQREPGAVTRLFGIFDDPGAGWTLETVPSKGRIGRDGLIVLQRRDDFSAGPGGFRMTSVRDEGEAKRQMAHLFIMRKLPMAPLWLQVGLGRYMSKYRVHYRDKLWVACFGSPVFDEPIRMHADGHSEGGGHRVQISIADLFDTDWYAYDRKLRYWYEYTAYALVHYLIHGENGYNGKRFPLLLRALAEGKDTEEALAAAYPHLLPDDWDPKLEAYMHPGSRRALLAANPNLAQGLCFRIPPEKDADFKPSRRPADPGEIQVLLDDLERVEPFRRHVAWFPTEIVEAEAAKHPRKGPRPPSPTAPGRSDKPTGDGSDPKSDKSSTPSVTVPVP